MQSLQSSTKLVTSKLTLFKRKLQFLLCGIIGKSIIEQKRISEWLSVSIAAGCLKRNITSVSTASDKLNARTAEKCSCPISSVVSCAEKCLLNIRQVEIR